MGMQGCEGEDGRVMSAHEAGRGVHDGHAAGAWWHVVMGVCVYVGGVVALMQCLGGGAGVYGCAASGDTALMWAAHNGHVEAVQHLLERGAHVHAATNEGACSDGRGAGPWNGLLSPPTREKV